MDDPYWRSRVTAMAARYRHKASESAARAASQPTVDAGRGAANRAAAWLKAAVMLEELLSEWRAEDAREVSRSTR